LSYEIEEGTEGNSPFHAALARAFARHGMSLECFCPAGDALARRVLEEYGAMFVAEGVRLPPVCVFETEGEVESFQREAGWRAAVLELERAGLFFSKDLSKSILRSVAAPGASQHLAMLAFDASEFQDARVRDLLARCGWFQTVLSDLPHFTYLGLEESELPSH